MKVVGTEQMFFLALMKRPGDYIFIDVSKLNIANGYKPHSLAELDSFTMCFTSEEIISAIKDANIVEVGYQMGKLVIQDNQRHKPLEVIDKTYLDNFKIETFIKDNINNKSLMNNITYKLSTIVSDELIISSFKKGIKENNNQLILNVIFSIEYTNQRKFILYLIDLYHKEKEKNNINELIRDKAA